MEKLSEIELARRDLWKGCLYPNNEKKLGKFAFIGVDRHRRYFIYNTSSLKPGIPYAWDSLRQLDGSPNEDTVCVDFDIIQLTVVKMYHSRH